LRERNARTQRFKRLKSVRHWGRFIFPSENTTEFERNWKTNRLNKLTQNMIDLTKKELRGLKIMKKGERLRKLKPLVFVFSLVYTIIVLIGSTFAWFTSSDNKINEFRNNMPVFSAQVVDVFNPLNPWKPGDNKEVSAVNTGEKNAFVRIMVLPVIMDGATPLQARIGEEIKITFLDIYNVSTNPTGKWIDGNDGYYYYLDVLKPSETAQPYLFKKVELKSGLPAEYDDATLKIEVKMESVGTGAYEYRKAWWNDETATGNLLTVDNILKDKVG